MACEWCKMGPGPCMLCKKAWFHDPDQGSNALRDECKKDFRRMGRSRRREKRHHEKLKGGVQCQ